MSMRIYRDTVTSYTVNAAGGLTHKTIILNNI
jgi:hypothetical protein